MATSTTSVTAGEVMDRAAVLMNDRDKTDYTYDVLLPFLNTAIDELMESLTESQSSPTTQTSGAILLPKGSSAIYPLESLTPPHYPPDLVEVQEVGERTAGTQDAFIPMTRLEFPQAFPINSALLYWSWENQIIKFNPNGANTDREIQIRYIKTEISQASGPNSIVGVIGTRSFLAYKTASLAAQFIGENQKRADELNDKAMDALERLYNIQNKGRQEISTRHRPFRAGWKARGGY